jgi:hypothetical protein
MPIESLGECDWFRLPAKLRWILGLFFRANRRVLRSKIFVPMISDGKISGVSWTRLNSARTSCASSLTSRVFPVPGTPSKITCPPERRATISCCTSAAWPTTIWFSAWDRSLAGNPVCLTQASTSVSRSRRSVTGYAFILDALCALNSI